MTETEAIKRFLAGEPVRIVEWRGINAQRIKWTDKESGKALEAPVCKHAVEAGPVQISVSERLEDNTSDSQLEAMNTKPPFKKGQKVVLVYYQQVVSKGNHSAQGVLELLDLAGGSRAAV